MIFDPLHVAAKTVALVQYRHMAVGEPGAFVERTARERAEPVEMWLDMAEQRIGQMDAQQIRQRRIGTVEIHSGCIGRKQPRRVAGDRPLVLLFPMVHIATLVRSVRCFR